MCRNLNIFLKPVKIKDFYFKLVNGTEYEVRTKEEIRELLEERREFAGYVAENCSKLNTKAGYDAAGMAIGLKDLDLLSQRLTSLEDRFGEDELDETIDELLGEVVPVLYTRTNISKDGGDLLRTWDRLYSRLQYNRDDFIVNFLTHIRQASQGDMYSEANAHPHQEEFKSERVKIHTVGINKKPSYYERTPLYRNSVFTTAHNGDINDAQNYKVFLKREGYVFRSNSDSCIIPALQRFIYEHIHDGNLIGALNKLAYTDPDLLQKKEFQADSSGRVGLQCYPLGEENKGAKVTAQIDGFNVRFMRDGEEAGNFKQRGFIRDDRYSTATHKILSLDRLARKLQDENAKKVTITAAVTARILEYSNSKNKFVFQTFSSIGRTKLGWIGGGTYNLVRGGTREGGEAGGEAVFYIPREHDRRNYEHVSVISASEEDALKERISLLDGEAFERNEIKTASTREVDIDHIPGYKIKAFISQGLAPVYDLLPGELLEINSDGDASVYDMYSAARQRLVSILDEKKTDQTAEEIDVKRERFAPLKVFKLEYRNEQGEPVTPPYNKYGEEIRVIQPLALADNTKLLFKNGEADRIHLRENNNGGLGLRMGADNQDVRELLIQSLRYKVMGAAGTSELIINIAENICRKLGLNKIPTLVLDGFTGSDTVPPYVDKNTLLIANSNSGGTSDTIKLVNEVTSLQSVMNRVESEMLRRDPSERDVGGTLALIDKIKSEIKKGRRIEQIDTQALKFLKDWMPWVYVITNIESSVLGNMGKGIDKSIYRPAGAGITNLPGEECVGSTFAAMASLQWQITLDAYLGEMRGEISHDYAQNIYTQLAKLPETVEKIVGDQKLIDQIEQFSERLVGGNYDFIYTGFVNGVPEEQAHKAAEMIQEMFVGWNFFMFQHGKYAHVKRQGRHSVGSVVGHNVPPPTWPFFNERAKKSAKEIGPRAAVCFMIAHDSDYHELASIPYYPPDFIFTYPEDSVVLYPFQVILIAQLISYIWGEKKQKIAEIISGWNEETVDILLKIPQKSRKIPKKLFPRIRKHCRKVLKEFTAMNTETQKLDRIEGRRREYIRKCLILLTNEWKDKVKVSSEALLNSSAHDGIYNIKCESGDGREPGEHLAILKSLALELSNSEQAKKLADHFLVDSSGRVSEKQYRFYKHNGELTEMSEYDYWCQYEGLGTFYTVDAVHPPKIAKAKKGWL